MFFRSPDNHHAFLSRRLRYRYAHARKTDCHRHFTAAWQSLSVVLCAVLFAVPVTAGPQLELSDAWVRAMPPTQKMTAAYMRIHNTGDVAALIHDVRSPLGDASLHETRVEEGRSSMRPVHTLRVAPGEVVELRPGGLHIMLMDLNSAPAEGDSVPLCLQTEERGVCTEARVQRRP